MTAGAHDAGGGFGRSAGANAVRGVAVIVAAVMLGFFLMARGIDDSSVAAPGDSDTTSTTAPADDGAGSTLAESTTITTAPPTDTSTPGTLAPQRNPAEVLTLAINGTDPTQGGAAGAMRDILSANNYAVADPKNADGPAPSAILYVEGYESDAIAIAALLGVDAAVVVKPFDPAASPIADTQASQVIVVVGNDGVIAV